MQQPNACVYDIETFPNCFQFGWADLRSNASGLFEISDRRNDKDAWREFINKLIQFEVEMIGFNNLFFDYPVIHELLLRPDEISAAKAHAAGQAIIQRANENRWAGMIWPDQRFVRQVDLYQINHFDNNAKRTSLKALQFAMRAESIEELPFDPLTNLTPEQMDVNGRYCLHDVTETRRFALFNEEEIAFRRALVPTYGVEALNWNDTKIGSQIIIRALGDEACYTRAKGQRRQAKGTFRTKIEVAEILFDYLKFDRPECNRVLESFRGKTIGQVTPGVISETCELDGFRFDFGVGGIHGSVDKRIVRADDDHLIIDADVTSLYPRIAIENGLYPEHLGPRFVDIYRGLADERVAKKKLKDSVAVAALKLALNGTYGNSNNAYSPIYDPRYTMQTTINGQLLLLMFAERLLAIPTVELIQINTDGVTFRVHKDRQAAVAVVCAQWQELTRLTLEFKLYSVMCIRDVNNYLAVDVDGTVKRKGAYDYPPTWKDYSGWWFRDYSALVVPMAAEAALLRGVDVAEFIEKHADPFDFMLRFKTPGASHLIFDPDGACETKLPKVTRYYAARADVGSKIVKLSPPVEGATPGHFKRKSGITDAEWRDGLRAAEMEDFDEGKRPAHSEAIHTKNKSIYEDRIIQVHACALPCLKMSAFKDWTLDRQWYVTEAAKLVRCFNA